MKHLNTQLCEMMDWPSDDMLILNKRAPMSSKPSARQTIKVLFDGQQSVKLHHHSLNSTLNIQYQTYQIGGNEYNQSEQTIF